MRKNKTYIIVILLVVFFLFSKNYFSPRVDKKQTGVIASPIPSTVLKSGQNDIKPVLSVSKSIFVPYWALGSLSLDTISYIKLYYFDVSIHRSGVQKDDGGYEGLSRFNCPKQKSCILVLAMHDADENMVILQDERLQENIIKQVMEITQEKSFDGIALDLEMSGIYSTDIKGQINNFVQQFYTMTKKYYKTFSFIVYGDAYYRKKPYDMKFIGNHSDEVVIMAYDLSKSYGEPGPNFNFDEKNKYGYDFKQMIKDFTYEVQGGKITVIFGMYGYDWTLNEQGTPLKRGEAITINQINKLTNSKFQITNKSQNSNSKEKKIEYTDNEGQKHVIYYEDEESAAIKTEYLKKQGIGNISFWAYSYF